MENNPVEDNFVTRFLLGFAVIVALMIGGHAVGTAVLSVGIPYGDWVGVAVGAVLTFVVFTVLYQRYDASYGADR